MPKRLIRYLAYVLGFIGGYLLTGLLFMFLGALINPGGSIDTHTIFGSILLFFILPTWMFLNSLQIGGLIFFPVIIILLLTAFFAHKKLR